MKTEPTPALLFATAAEALAFEDNRKMFQMSFKGVAGTVFVIASTEHQAKMAMLNNVVTVKKISHAERCQMLSGAFAELMRKVESNNLPPTETKDAPAEHTSAEPADETRVPDARSSTVQQVAEV
jgi:hypothetical protein